MLSQAESHRETSSSRRKQDGRHKQGASRAASKNASCTGGWHKRDEPSMAKDEATHLAKRRRLSEDAKMVLHYAAQKNS